jgi:hypothetical protein
LTKHVSWSINDIDEPDKILHGRAGVRLDSDRVKLVNLGNYALPACLLLPVLNAALGDGWISTAEELHLKRKHPWKVETHEGMSGAKNYQLRVCENEDWLYMPVRARIHVSMYGKLNEGLRMWLGDLPPLLAKLLEDFPPPKTGYEVSTQEIDENVSKKNFAQPGAPSGLQEVIEAIKSMEVLADADDAY